MALSKENVKRAIAILGAMMEWEGKIPTKKYDKDKPDELGAVLLAGKVGDGYENVFVNVPGINREHLDHFYEHKHEVHNSHFIHTPTKEGITCIGWF